MPPETESPSDPSEASDSELPTADESSPVVLTAVVDSTVERVDGGRIGTLTGGIVWLCFWSELPPLAAITIPTTTIKTSAPRAARRRFM